MASIARGQTFGSTEQVTNTKLHNLVDLATISAINSATDIAAGFMQSMPSAAGRIPPQNFWAMVTGATNASIPDVRLATHFWLNASTFCSLATILAQTFQQFTLVANQASFPALIDANNMRLNGNWIPAKQFDNITLLSISGSFVEIGRTLV